MATIHHSHQRTPSSGHKFVLRPSGTARPYITKNHSSGKLSTKSAQHAKRRSADVETDNLVEDFDMAMSFHQFCTTCEKQIAVPNSSILYCSESCRRRDGTLSISFGAPASPPLLSEYEAFTRRPALSRRKLQHTLSAPAVPAAQHEGKADMDPTEWKPDAGHALPGATGVSSSSAVPRRPSEAMLYLSQYYRSSDSLMSRRSSKDKQRKEISVTAPGVITGAGGAKGFSLTPAGSNDSSPATSPIESAGVSVMSAGTAPSLASGSSPHSEDEQMKKKSNVVGGMGFGKKVVGAREQ